MFSLCLDLFCLLISIFFSQTMEWSSGESDVKAQHADQVLSSLFLTCLILSVPSPVFVIDLENSVVSLFLCLVLSVVLCYFVLSCVRSS